MNQPTNRENSQTVDDKEFEAYNKWSRSYFGHGMPPSQNYYESTMSAFHAGIESERARSRVLVEALDKFVILSNAASFYVRMEEIKDRTPIGLARAVEALYSHQCEVERYLEEYNQQERG